AGEQESVLFNQARTIWAPGSSWEIAPAMSQEIRGAPVLTFRPSPDKPVWLELLNADFSGMGAACLSPDGRYAAWSDARGAITLADLPALRQRVQEFERSLRLDESSPR